jgi:hypothetical protein
MIRMLRPWDFLGHGKGQSLINCHHKRGSSSAPKDHTRSSWCFHLWASQLGHLTWRLAGLSTQQPLGLSIICELCGLETAWNLAVPERFLLLLFLVKSLLFCVVINTLEVSLWLLTSCAGEGNAKCMYVLANIFSRDLEPFISTHTSSSAHFGCWYKRHWTLFGWVFFSWYLALNSRPSTL